MSVTHNKFRSIEAKVFSTESSSLDENELLDLKSELMETHSDATELGVISQD